MPVTRRTFLRSFVAATATALAGCGSLAGVLPSSDAPGVLGTTTLTIWTTSYTIDAALARWRGTHSRQSVTRKVAQPAQLGTWITECLRGERPIPDLVITDASTIAAWNMQSFWRHLQTDAQTDALHVPNGRMQATDATGARFAIPIAVNPLGAWYSRSILGGFMPGSHPEQVEAAFGPTAQSFTDFLGRAATANPRGPLLSSTLDDYVLPQLDNAVMHGIDIGSDWQESLITAARNAQQQRLVAAERHYSGNWYQGISHEHTGIIIAGRWMQQALRRVIDAPISDWRLCAPAGGYIAGPSLLCAVPEASNHPEQAIALATDLANNTELQLLVSDAGGLVPSLLAAHQDAPFVGSDSFCTKTSVFLFSFLNDVFAGANFHSLMAAEVPLAP